MELNNTAVVIWIHGGGAVIGDQSASHTIAMSLSTQLNSIVIAPIYRLAPEHKFPAQTVDVTNMIKFVSKKYPSSKIAIMGESFGGNLAAVGAIINVEQQITNRLCLQGLVVPWLVMDTITESMLSTYSNDGYGHITLHQILAFKRAYLPIESQSEAATSYLASPVRAPKAIIQSVNYPPTLLVAGKLDALYDDSVMFHRLLSSNHAKSEFYSFNQGHVFIGKPLNRDTAAAERILVEGVRVHCM